MANKYELVADVSSYQPDTLDFFKALKAKGVKAVIIKLTEGSKDGSNYVNPKAKKQKANAEKAGLIVHAYHYAKYNGIKDAQNEADFFTETAKKLGFSKNSVLADDVEDTSQKYDCTADTKAFLERVKKNGFKNVDLYTMASWIWNGRLKLNSLPKINLWVANYGVNQPNVDNVGTWQYTSAFPVAGLKIDMSYDFNGYYTKAKKASNNSAIVKKDTWKDSVGDTWHKEKGTFTTKQRLKLRWGAKESSSEITTLKVGSVIKYDNWSDHDGYRWLRQPRNNGKYAYVKCKNLKSGKYFGKFSK